MDPQGGYSDVRSIDARLAAPRHHIVLSPHYDDMALSLGASIAAVAQAGRDVTDLIVFGSEPTGIELHAFARHHHDAWGLTAAEAIAARQAEEADAVRILGARTANLPFHDAIYRSDHYMSDAALFGTPAAGEATLPRDIAAAAISWARANVGSEGALGEAIRFYAPLAIGNHVDHQIVFAAARELAGDGYDVWLYEDLPYAMIGDNAGRRHSAIRAMSLSFEPVGEFLVEIGWRQRIAAILAYPSQLQTVFGNNAGIAPEPVAIEAALGAWHREIATGGGEPVERFWRFAGV